MEIMGNLVNGRLLRLSVKPLRSKYGWKVLYRIINESELIAISGSMKNRFIELEK